MTRKKHNILLTLLIIALIITTTVYSYNLGFKWAEENVEFKIKGDGE